MVPPERSSVYADHCECGLDRLERYIHDIFMEEGEMVIIINGDLNARTGLEQDFILDDSSTYIPGGEEYESDIFSSTRNSVDTVVNSFGKRLIDLCCTYSIHIVNGRKR